MKPIALALCLSACFSFSHTAFGWGMTGHRVVGQIASAHLTPKAKKAVKALLGHTSLAEASTWPDEVRSDHAYDHTHTWHYANFAKDKGYLGTPRAAKGDVIEALCRMEDILRKEKGATKEREEALKFLVHLMGDIHQPLHVGYAEDQGGNKFSVNWFQKSTNLHAVWDEDMVDYEKFSYTELSKILNHFADDEVKSYQSGTYLDWANESAALVPGIYPEANAKLGYLYHYQNKPTMRLRLRQAGIRLAYILNRIFKDEELSSAEQELRGQIQKMPLL